MNTKKRGPTLLLAMVAIVTILGGTLVYKSKVIASQKAMLGEIGYTHNLIQSIEQRVEVIQALREENKLDCQILAETGDVPQKLEWVCG